MEPSSDVGDGEEVYIDSSCASSSCSCVEHTVTEVQSLRTEKGKVEKLTKDLDYVRLMDISNFGRS